MTTRSSMPRSQRRGFLAEPDRRSGRGSQHRCLPTARSSAGFKDVWNSGRGLSAIARCSRIPAALGYAIRSTAESSIASRSDRLVRRSWPKTCADWFEIPTKRPGAASCRDLMILAYPVRPERAALIPAVVHQDGTCRLQIVDREQTPLFHALIADSASYRVYRWCSTPRSTTRNRWWPRRMMPSEPSRRRKSMPFSWEIALFDDRDNGLKPAQPQGASLDCVGPARSRLRRAFSSRYAIGMAGGSHWFSVIMPRRPLPVLH